LVHKPSGDSFEDTDLEEVLAAGGVGHLAVAGVAFDS
jgi:nicotinamidase-related amidase